MSSQMMQQCNNLTITTIAATAKRKNIIWVMDRNEIATIGIILRI